MAPRSYSDVPNRVVRLFLQDAGRQYDINRHYTPFRRLTASLNARFGENCAYCGMAAALVEEHLVPMNRTDVGLHAWGNIVPACRACNYTKAGKAWESHPKLDDVRRQTIRGYIEEFHYAPDVTELRNVVEKLYELTDSHTRALVEFGLIASQPFIAGLHTQVVVSPKDVAHFGREPSYSSEPPEPD